MKRVLSFIVALSISLTLFAQETATKTKVAIYTSGDVNASYKKVIGSKVTSIITQSGNYAAVERTSDFLNVLSQEHDYQISGSVNDGMIVKLGEQFGVRYVVVVDISDLFGSLFVSARMIDVRTGLIKKSADLGQEVDSMESLIRLSTLIGYAIIGTDMYKCEGPFIEINKLFEFLRNIPKGYRIATKSDILTITEVFRIHGTPLYYPIYCDVKYNDGNSQSVSCNVIKNANGELDSVFISRYYSNYEEHWKYDYRIHYHSYVYLIKE